MSSVQLPVKAFDATSDGWEKYGSDPYLDAQEGTSYVEDADRNSNCGYFTFETSVDLGSITSVYLYIYAWAVETLDFEALINDVQTGLNPPTSPGWVNIEITSIISSWAEVNAATLLLDRSNTKNLAGCDAAYILVNYTTGPSPGWNDLEYDAEPPSAGWNKLEYSSEPPVSGAWNQVKYKP